jgi:hypothetical protein
MFTGGTNIVLWEMSTGIGRALVNDFIATSVKRVFLRMCILIGEYPGIQSSRTCVSIFGLVDLVVEFLEDYF